MMRWTLMCLVGLAWAVASGASPARCEDAMTQPASAHQAAGVMLVEFDPTGVPAAPTPVAMLNEPVAKPPAPPKDVVAVEQDDVVRMAPADPAPRMWHPPQPLKPLGINISGWLQQSVTFNADQPLDRFNGPVATGDRANEYQMNQFWLTFERKINTEERCFDIGGRLDMMYGSDWRFGINHGLEDRINGFDYQPYGMVIPQMYGEIGYNRLSVKIGHFASILDYEGIPAPVNPFFSHSYCYPYTTPVLETGMLADYRLTDKLSIQGGFHRGWMQFEDNNDKLNFTGGVRWHTDDNRTSVAYAVDNGAWDDTGELNRFASSLVVQEQLTKKLRYVFVHNYGTQEMPTGDAEWYGICQYFLYSLNPKWSANLRAEWLRDDDGVRVAGPGNIPGVKAWAGNSFAGNFYELTAGLNWRPKANILVRPEVRYDWYDGPAGFVHGDVPGLPFDNGEKRSQLLFASDLVWLF